ncbi:MAG TPA: hypothetical protein VEA81_04275 [Burkholderiaceae bacterium]|nr:hypothetical protein [Burkholderiaceae bacterium]
MNGWTKAAAALGAAATLAGCAGPRIDGQWSDPAFANRTLRAQRVLVTCRGPDATLARLCEDRLAESLRENGVDPVRAQVPLDAAAGADAVARAAREAGASAAVASSLTVAGTSGGGYGFGPSVGFGLGGIGGGGGGFSFGGVGLSVPLGGVRPATTFATSTTVLDAGSAREIWSVRVLSSRGDDASVQVADLGRESVAQMRKSGLFEAR